MYSIHEQYLDMGAGFHVIELRNEHKKQHLLQIAVGAQCCPACGSVHAKDNLGQIDPRAMAERVSAELSAADAAMLAYAAKHGVPVR